ncbi:sigma factor [Segatella copri]
MRCDLKAYALRLTESDDNAEDLVQEVMLRLWDIR